MENVGANLISPLKNSDFILAFEAGVQDFEKDHKITSKCFCWICIFQAIKIF